MLDIRSTVSLGSAVSLPGDVAMPRLGLGVWQADEKETRAAVRWALAAGYRHIDSAMIYGNEAAVGAAVREADVPRREIFVTTKLWTDDHGHDAALRAFDASAKRLDVGVIDLYLSHYPVSGKRVETWKALRRLRDEGRVRAVGVSNYTVRHLQEIMDATGEAPAVNQVELHPYLVQNDLVAFCEKHRIVVEAYSPLTHGKKLKDPPLVAIAQRVGRTPAQVLIRWSLQRGFVVIPKSVHEARIRENAAVFDFSLSEADMRALDGLDEGLRVCWDPTDTP